MSRTILVLHKWSDTTITPLDLDLTQGGTFARSSAAYYYTQAPTDGSSAFLASASPGTRRVENRGDGLGIGYLSEKSATNYVLRSRALDNAAWTAGAGSISADAQAGPDGSGIADRETLASGQYGVYQASPGPSGAIVTTAWHRAVSGTSSHTLVDVENATNRTKAHTASNTTTWARNECAYGTSVSNSGVICGDGRDLAGLGTPGGAAAHAEDNHIDMVQLEAGYYPTSPIDTTSGTATRAADTLSYASGQYPAAFFTTGMKIILAPDASSLEMRRGVTGTPGPITPEEWRIVQLGGADCVRLYYDVANSGAVCLELVIGGSAVATLSNVTFSRGQVLTITAKPSAGSITLSGATTGDGTTSSTGGAWVGGGGGIMKVYGGADGGGGVSTTLYVGGDAGGGLNVTGRYLDARALGLIPCIQVAP